MTDVLYEKVESVLDTGKFMNKNSTSHIVTDAVTCL